MNAEQQLNQWGQIVAKTWQDDTFKKRLLDNPSAVLKDEGLAVAPGIQIRVVENTDKVQHFTLPARPRVGELSEAELAGVAGGKVSFGLLSNLQKVFGWNADQVGQILEAHDGKLPAYPSTGGGGDLGSSGDDGRE